MKKHGSIFFLIIGIYYLMMNFIPMYGGLALKEDN